MMAEYAVMSTAAKDDHGPLKGSVVVLSPHLDDAVLSLGASIASSVRAGAKVRVVTVFAGDPASTRPPSTWEVRCGFTSAAEAARKRRIEDVAACARIGATPTWLAYPDIDHSETRDTDQIGPAIEEAIAGADMVLMPGSPLLHPDHQLVTKLTLERRPPGVRFGFYAEQPYVFWEFVGPLSAPARIAAWSGCLLRTRGTRRLQEPITPPDLAPWTPSLDWQLSRTSPKEELRKLRAIRSYASQLHGFGRLFTSQIVLYEWGRGGESLAWLAPS
jgi:LmbE family N-acetylglucosaminyl deacetylase